MLNNDLLKNLYLFNQILNVLKLFSANAFFDKKLMPTLDRESNRVTVSSKTAEGRHHYVLKCCTRTEMAATFETLSEEYGNPPDSKPLVFFLNTMCQLIFTPKLFVRSLPYQKLQSRNRRRQTFFKVAPIYYELVLDGITETFYSIKLAGVVQ